MNCDFNPTKVEVNRQSYGTVACIAVKLAGMTTYHGHLG